MSAAFAREGALFGSVILEVLLGLVLLYAWFSLACSALTEFLETLRAQRGKQLAIAVTGMLGEQLRQQFYEHGLIRSLSKGQRLPSYLSAYNFALVTLSLLGIDATNFRERVYLVQGGLGDTLRALVRSTSTYESFVYAVERWFDATMDRCSGWFRRRARWASFLTSLVMAVALNVDSIEVASTLYSDNLLRMSAVTHAEQVAATQTVAAPPQVGALGTSARNSTGGLPIGWQNARLVTNWDAVPHGPAFWFGPVLSKIFGLLATALAGSLGAAFWFDALKRLVALRSSIAHRGLPEQLESASAQRMAPSDGVKGPMMLPLGGASGPRTMSGFESQTAGIAVYPIVGVGPSS